MLCHVDSRGRSSSTFTYCAVKQSRVEWNIYVSLVGGCHKSSHKGKPDMMPYLNLFWWITPHLTVAFFLGKVFSKFWWLSFILGICNMVKGCIGNYWYVKGFVIGPTLHLQKKKTHIVLSLQLIMSLQPCDFFTYWRFNSKIFHSRNLAVIQTQDYLMKYRY